MKQKNNGCEAFFFSSSDVGASVDGKKNCHCVFSNQFYYLQLKNEVRISFEKIELYN
jgi:hypothetical protein